MIRSDQLRSYTYLDSGADSGADLHGKVPIIEFLSYYAAGQDGGYLPGTVRAVRFE